MIKTRYHKIIINNYFIGNIFFRNNNILYINTDKLLINKDLYFDEIIVKTEKAYLFNKIKITYTLNNNLPQIYNKIWIPIKFIDKIIYYNDLQTKLK